MYGTLQAFRTYWADRGNTLPTDTPDTQATQALLRGSDYIRTRYVAQHWLDTTDAELLALIEEATYIAALQELTTPGFWTTTYTPSQQKVLTEVAGVKWTLVPGSFGANGALPTSPAIEGLLFSYLGYGRLPAIMVV